MINRSKFERFSGNNFLLERGQATLRYLTQRWRQRLTSFLVRFLLFGGFLGLMWTLSHVEPQGDLSLYLIPITLLALPIGLIAPREKSWEKALNILFIGTFSSFLIWSGVWYFQYYEWGYQFKWFFLEACLLFTLTFFTWYQSSKSTSEPQYSLLWNLWIVGIAVIFSALGFLAYYLITQTAPETSTATILSGSTFVFFLALTIVRVFWLDGIRYRRANRSEHVSPQDHILLLEWLIPRSYSFVVTLALLLVSEAMMFSTIYRATQVKHGVIQHSAHKDNTIHPIPYSSRSLKSSSQLYTLPEILPSSTVIPLQNKEQPNSIKSAKLQQTHMQEIVLSEWIFFSFKPYVFPKDNAGREAEAPRWFKYLGRALLGLIFAILLTKQLNIWKQLSALYITLLGAARRVRLRGETRDLQDQQREMIANLNAIFNNHAPFWRWQLFYAVTAPTLSLKWRLLLDPSSAFYMGLDRLLLWVVARWDMALFSIGLVLLASTAPFAYLDTQLLPHFYDAMIPITSSAILIGILRIIIGIKPPKSYQFWIWWILLIHMVTTLLCFFLSINIGTKEAFWPSILWYLQICSIGIFPALYLFGGERHRKISNIMHRQDVSTQDCDYVIRINMLKSFVHTEHRQWLAQEITQLIHPVRSGSLQLRLLIPSLLIGVLDTLRIILERSNQLFKWITARYSRALLTWMSIQILVWLISFLTHLFTFHRLLPEQIVVAYLLNLTCLLIPTITPLFFAKFKKYKVDLSQLNQKKYIKPILILNLAATMAAIILWIRGYNHSPVWKETTRYSWFTFVFIPPWLPVWTFVQHLLSQRKPKNSNQNLGLFERLARWLSKQETHYLTSVYERVNRARPLDDELRHELIRSCATLTESTYQALCDGSWYEEERHAIRRVYRQWISGLERIEEEEEIAEELAYLQEQVLDTLGSLLYDLSVTQRFDQKRTQDIQTILESLIRILHLPNPKTLNQQDSSVQELQSCYQSLYALCTWLLHQLMINQKIHVEEQAHPLDHTNEDQTEVSVEENSEDDLDDTQQYDTQLHDEVDQLDETDDDNIDGYTENSDFKVFQLNIEDSSQPVVIKSLLKICSLLQKRLEYDTLDLHIDLYPQLDPIAIIEAACLHPKGIEYIEPYLVSFDPKHLSKSDVTREALSSYIQLTLPTPIALLEKDLIQHRNKYLQQLESIQNTPYQHKETTDLLSALQSPRALLQLRSELLDEQHLVQYKQQQYRTLYHAYFSIFAYLLGILKDQESNQWETLQDLSWNNATELTHSIKLLRRKKAQIHSQELASLIFTLFNHSECRLIERIYQTQQNWERGFDIWRTITLYLCEHESKVPFLYWRPQANIGKSLVLKGLYPQNYQMEEEVHRLGRGVRLKNYDLRPLIDYYPALWLLKLLDGLAQSDGLFHPENDEVAVDRLQKLADITQRFAKLLRPFAPEEQRVVIRMYQHINKRLSMLSDLHESDLEDMDGQGDLDFNLTLNKIYQYLSDLEERVLRRFEHLLKLELLPSQEFCYLAGIEACDPDELRWYHRLGEAEPILYLCMSFLGMAEGGYRFQSIDQSPTSNTDSAELDSISTEVEPLSIPSNL